MKFFKALLSLVFLNYAVAAVLQDVKYEKLNLVGQLVNRFYSLEVPVGKREECCITKKSDILGTRCVHVKPCTYG